MPASKRETIRHPNGQVSAYVLDSFVDPWQPAETILLQHGFARTADHFYHWVPALSRHYNVLRRDLRGHGESSYPEPGQDGAYDYSLATIMKEIKDTLDQLNIEKVHFVGESTSGMLAEIFAANTLSVCSQSLFARLPLTCRNLPRSFWRLAKGLGRRPAVN